MTVSLALKATFVRLRAWLMIMPILLNALLVIIAQVHLSQRLKLHAQSVTIVQLVPSTQSSVTLAQSTILQTRIHHPIAWIVQSTTIVPPKV